MWKTIAGATQHGENCLAFCDQTLSQSDPNERSSCNPQPRSTLRMGMEIDCLWPFVCSCTFHHLISVKYTLTPCSLPYSTRSLRPSTWPEVNGPEKQRCQEPL